MIVANGSASIAVCRDAVLWKLEDSRIEAEQGSCNQAKAAGWCLQPRLVLFVCLFRCPY